MCYLSFKNWFGGIIYIFRFQALVDFMYCKHLLILWLHVLNCIFWWREAFNFKIVHCVTLFAVFSFGNLFETILLYYESEPWSPKDSLLYNHSNYQNWEINIDTNYYLVYWPYFNFTSCPNLGPHVSFIVTTTKLVLESRTVLEPLSSKTLVFLKSSWQLFPWTALSLCLSDVSSRFDSLTHFWQKLHRNNALSLSAHHILGHMIPICRIPDDDDVVIAWLRGSWPGFSIVIFSPLKLIKDTLRLCKYLVSHLLHCTPTKARSARLIAGCTEAECQPQSRWSTYICQRTESDHQSQLILGIWYLRWGHTVDKYNSKAETRHFS